MGEWWGNALGNMKAKKLYFYFQKDVPARSATAMPLAGSQRRETSGQAWNGEKWQAPGSCRARNALSFANTSACRPHTLLREV